MQALGICVRCAQTTDRRPACLADLGETDPDYVTRRATMWASDTGYSWAVCEPTTGEMLGEVRVDPLTATVSTRARDGHGDAAAIAEQSVRRFAAAMLGLTIT